MSVLEDGLLVGLSERGLSRRTFLKFCATMTAVLALPAAYAPRVAAAVAAAPRMPVIWLRGQGCGGETEALLQAANPSTATLLLDLLSVDYQDALMAGSAATAEASRAATMRQFPNGYFAVIEGAVPTADDGVYLTLGGRSFADVVREVTAGAVATIALGSCAFDGGLAGASGGATGATGVSGAVSKSPLINLPGCPVNVDNLTATIVHYLTFKEVPATDLRGRPLFAYGALVHNECERRPHFEFGEFVQAWGDEGAQKGWCLYKMGCKGPETFANCASVRFGEGTSWPVEAGAGCIGCTMPGFWDTMSPFGARLPSPIPFVPDITADQVGLAAVAGVGGLAVVHGTASFARSRLRAPHRPGVVSPVPGMVTAATELAPTADPVAARALAAPALAAAAIATPGPASALPIASVQAALSEAVAVAELADIVELAAVDEATSAGVETAPVTAGPVEATQREAARVETARSAAAEPAGIGEAPIVPAGPLVPATVPVEVD